MIAAKAFDPVLGIDIHMIQPPGPVPPVPVPHPFVGMLIDPMDFAPIIGATVMVNGMPRATAGTGGQCIPPHIPIGGVFIKPPGNECEVFMGSSTVLADGDPLSFLGMPALSCHDIGMPPPPRVKKKRKPKSLALPTSVVLAVPMGPPVLVGGPPTISMMALGMKAAMAGLGKAFKKLKKLKAFKKAMKKFKKAKQKAFKNMKPGFLKCKVLKAEPVNAITGEVVVEQRDFTLAWRVPVDWQRRYGSQQERVGSVGRGWETPADARLEFDAAGLVTFHDGGAGAAIFHALPEAGPVLEVVGGASLDRAANGFVVRTREGLRHYFPARLAGARETLVARVEDECGNWLQYVRDGVGSLLELHDSSGQRLIARGRDGLLEMLSVRDVITGELHQLVSYEYNVRGDLTTVYDAQAAPYHFDYDEQRRLRRHTNRTGLSFHYEYDGPGQDARCLHAFGDGGLYDYRFEYDPDAQQVRVTDSLGHLTVLEHDDYGLPVLETDPRGAVTTYEYDEAGRCCAVLNPIGRRTEWHYGEAGDLLALVRPDGSRLVAEYGAGHRATSLTDPAGRTLRFEYERGRLTSRTAPRGGRWTYEYDDHGDLVAMRDPGGVWKRFESDRFGNVIAVHESSGASIRVQRNGRGNIIARSPRNGPRATYRYDRKGRLVAARYADGRSITCAYDAEDNIVTYREEGGSTVHFRYAGLGRLAERIAGDGSSVCYEYDMEERLVAVTNERGEVSRFERDALGRVTREIDYWTQARSYEYDPAGRMVAATNPLGERIELQRDALDRVTRRVLPDGAVESYRYDPAGNLVAASGPGGRVQRAYDEDGNLVREVTNGITIESQYDLAGRRTHRSTSLGNELEIAYDETGRTGELLLNARPLASMEYDGGGRLKSERLGQHLHREYQHDPTGRVVRQTLRRDAATLAELVFRYDTAGRVVERRGIDDDLAVFEYDPAGRVRRFTSPAMGLQELSYDVAGDLTRPVDESLAPGELRAVAWRGVTQVYDAAGRVVRRLQEGGETRFTWDAADRLVDCTTNAGQRLEFSYDPLGRRTAKRVAGHPTRFAWDDQQLMGVVPDGGEPREYVFRPDSFRPLAVANGSVCYYETDTVGLPHAVFAEDGTRTWHGRFDALASLVAEVEVGEEQPLRLQGQYHDAETGLTYNRHRYYDGHTGSFVSQDPLRYRAGPNLYSYGPSVWNWVDVFGLECKTVTVYRVEGPGNARVHIDGNGNVSIPDKSKYLYVSFRDQAHAEYFLKKKQAEFPDSTIKAFDVPEDVVNDIQKKAVPQADASDFPGAPQISDPTVAKKLGMDEQDVLGVKGDDIAALEENAIPGSGKEL